MKKSFLSLITLAIVTSGVSAFAGTLTCTTGKDSHGGFRSIIINTDGDQVTVKGVVSGGEAMFMGGFGPVLTQVAYQADSVTYTWTDSYQQSGELTIVTSDINGELVRVGTSDYGMWANVNLNCN